jgi:hypothetical protein
MQGPESLAESIRSHTWHNTARRVHEGRAHVVVGISKSKPRSAFPLPRGLAWTMEKFEVLRPLTASRPHTLLTSEFRGIAIDDS